MVEQWGGISMICRVCDSTKLELAIDLGMQPWCNHFLRPDELGKEPYYPLRVVHCQNCETAQLDFTVPKEVMFSNHTYLSGVTKSLNLHFKGVAEEVDRRFFKNTINKSVLDIGSNDGTQLKYYKELGYHVLGVESSKNISRLANEAGIETINAFFDLNLARQLNRKFHVINAAGVFFHLEELHSVTEGIRELLHPEGVFVVQFLYMKNIIENGAFDQIYHEHLLYYNLMTIEYLLQRHGLSMFDAYWSPIHGGSIVGFICHKDKANPSSHLQKLRKIEVEGKVNDLSTYLCFAKRIELMRLENVRYLEYQKRSGKKIYGLGAPAKGNTLLNYFRIGPDLIEYLVEKNELRRGLYSPGMHIPIVIEREWDVIPDVYYVLAWNFRDEILANYQSLIKRGVEFYFPVHPQGAQN